MPEKHIIVTNTEDFAIHFDPKGLEYRDKLIAVTKEILIVNDKETLDKCVKQSGVLQGYVKEVENAGKSAREPFNKAATTVIQLEKEATTPAKTERERLNKLAAEYQQREQDRIKREEQARLEEQRRQQEEIAKKQREEELRLAKIKADQEAEQKRLDDLAKKAKNDADRLAAQKKQEEFEAAKKKQEEQEAEKLRQEALEKSFEEPPAPVIVEKAQKVAGATQKKVWKFEVVDIKALYAAHPDCVKLVEKRTEILDLIQLTGGTKEIPGVKFSEEIQISTRGRMNVTALEN